MALAYVNRSIGKTGVREQLQSQGYMYLRVVKLLHAIRQFLSDGLHQWRNYHWLLLVPEMVLAEDVVTVLLGESSGLNHSDLCVRVCVISNFYCSSTQT